jgi:outer membrane murein-binding lipoprotein Lpp
MKLIVIAVTMLVLIGCSSAPSKNERIEANRVAIESLDSKVRANAAGVKANRAANADTDTKIDRMFEKSQYK